MTPAQLRPLLGDLPYMSQRKADILYALIKANKLSVALELGFYHGVSSAYIAGALEEVEGGRLTTLDLKSAERLQPNIEELLHRTGQTRLVNWKMDDRGYSWLILKMLEDGLQGTLDFCYLDGGHNWQESGFATCLLAKLLRPGGWLVLDDLDYTYDRSSKREHFTTRLSVEECESRQVEMVFKHLVRSNPLFDNVRKIHGMGFARKSPAGETGRSEEDIEDDRIISTVLDHATQDPQYRRRLLLSPADIISQESKRVAASCTNFVFERSESCAPTPYRVEGGGVLRAFIEAKPPRPIRVDR